MLWLEMTHHGTHGGDDWDFTKSIWAPSEKKNNKGGWPFWENVLKVKAGDLILHLNLSTKDSAFVGISNVESDGFETTSRPRLPGQWNYSPTFYRASLKDFEQFQPQIFLQDTFSRNKSDLTNYFLRNKAKSKKSKKSLFYVLQSGRLQCLNGAYLSEVDEELAGILFHTNFNDINDLFESSLESQNFEEKEKNKNQIAESKIPYRISTNETQKLLSVRIGQNRFSDKVKANFNHQCCFPDCTVKTDEFLVGSHIARWADVLNLRGNLENGLCLCLMHDKAFELGCFTLDESLKVVINKKNKLNSDLWNKTNLLPFEGKEIHFSKVKPTREVLEYHWKRIGIDF